MKKSVIVLALLASMNSYGQKKKLRYQDKSFQLSLVPGISSHGLNDAWYFNKFSLNILSGVSAGSRHLELAGISNLSTQFTTGIQIAGFANVIGSNAFINLTKREERDLIVEDDFSSYYKGFQFAGFLNNVRNDVTGIQFSGGFNISGGSLKGLQLSGIGNIATENMTGIQLSGLYNIGTESAAGIQLSTLLNYSNGAMGGMQISLINKNRMMVGKRSKVPYNKGKSVQLGLLNMSREMNGTQIGLVNIARGMKGTQIGLINIFSTKPSKDSGNSGVPIGIINFGSKGGFLRVSNNELFLYNAEASTGNCTNCSATQFQFPLTDDYQKFNQNTINISYNPEFYLNNKPYWSIGYGFERLMYRIYSVFPKKSGPQNKAFYLAVGAKVQHLNWTQDLDTSINIQTSIYAKAGKRFKFLGGSHYVYAGIRLNDYVTENPEYSADNKWMMLKIEGVNFSNRIWPGYEIGIQI